MLSALETAAASSCACPEGHQTSVACAPFAEDRLNWIDCDLFSGGWLFSEGTLILPMRVTDQWGNLFIQNGRVSSV